jgi:hypothetical protein
VVSRSALKALLNRRKCSLPRKVRRGFWEHSLAFQDGFKFGTVRVLPRDAQSIPLADIRLKVPWEMILQEFGEGNSLVTAKASEVPSVPARHLIQRTFYPPNAHWTTFMVFASVLTVRALELMPTFCLGEKPK